VVVIDPNDRVAELIAHALRRHGYMVTTTDLRPRALTDADSEAVDLVLLDPTASSWEQGLQLCRDLRARSHIPVVLVTSRCLTEEIDQALAAGAADVICKPFSPLELVARVGFILNDRRAPLG
jgi:DNA-binding response OmpR family regulator